MLGSYRGYCDRVGRGLGCSSGDRPVSQYHFGRHQRSPASTTLQRTRWVSPSATAWRRAQALDKNRPPLGTRLGKAACPFDSGRSTVSFEMDVEEYSPFGSGIGKERTPSQPRYGESVAPRSGLSPAG